MERRLAAILVADMVGYSRLIELDETGTITRQKHWHTEVITPLIKQYRGRLFKTTGDGILVEFGSAVDAVSCAVEMQIRINKQESGQPKNIQLKYRIGVNLGDVVIDGEDVVGDGVNVAARLESLADPGGVCVSESVRTAVSKILPYKFKFLGQKSVKNIAIPVSAYQVSLNEDEIPSARSATWKSSKITQASLATILFLAAIGLGFYFLIFKPQENIDKETTQLTYEDKEKVQKVENPSIAVLPFANKGEGKAQDYFSDGITDDILTDLTKVPGLLVITRDSSFAFRDKEPDPRRISQVLKSKFVLQGNIRRSDKQIRINVTLIEGSTGQVIWAERYDDELDNIFSLQDKITKKIVTSLALKISPAEYKIPVALEIDDMISYELFLRGRDQFLRFSKDDTFGSRQLFHQAIQRSPKFARAYAYMGWTYAFEFTNGWSGAPEKTLANAMDFAEKATNIDDKLPIAYFVKALVHRERRNYIEALAEAQRAIEIDHNYANAYIMLATILYYGGRAEEGLELVEKAERINPLHPSNYPFHKGQALFILRRYAEAAEAFEKGLNQNPTSQRLRVWLAATYAQLGRQEDAEWEADQILLYDPNFMLTNLVQVFPFNNPADLQRFNSALKKIGFSDRW